MDSADDLVTNNTDKAVRLTAKSSVETCAIRPAQKYTGRGLCSRFPHVLLRTGKAQNN
jgi:hypothetical protein